MSRGALGSLPSRGQGLPTQESLVSFQSLSLVKGREPAYDAEYTRALGVSNWVLLLVVDRVPLVGRCFRAVRRPLGWVVWESWPGRQLWPRRGGVYSSDVAHASACALACVAHWHCWQRGRCDLTAIRTGADFANLCTLC